MSDQPSLLGSLKSLFTQPDSEKSNARGASFLDLLSDPDAAGEKPSDQPPLGEETFDEASFFWAMRNLPIREATKHFLVCGCIGSGKTVTIQLFLQSIAPRFRRDRKKPEQLILFDAKNDAVDLLKALRLDPGTPDPKPGNGTKGDPNAPDVWILNPADPNSSVWNIAEAVRSPMMARHLATLMVPEERSSTAPYFTDGARELVYAVLLGLCSAGGVKWKFRDLLCALESKERILAVASQNPRAATLAARMLADEKHAPGILSTLGTKLGRFEQVAALWHSRGKQGDRDFSVRRFLRRPGVLVLGNDPVLRDSFWPINAMLLKALTQEILREPNTFEPRHWFVLDEFRAMENVQCIHDLLNRGRSKGASVLLGLQSIDGLMEVYGEHGANDILTQCASKSFLRAGGPVTAQWAERFFGQVRCKEKVLTESRHGLTSSTSTQHNITERSVFIASYFMNLPLPRPGGEYAAVCDVPCLDRYFIVNRSFDEVLSWCKPVDKPESETEDLPPKMSGPSPAEEILQPWTKEEEAGFCKSTTVVVAPGKASPLPSIHSTKTTGQLMSKPRGNQRRQLPPPAANPSAPKSNLQTRNEFQQRRNSGNDPLSDSLEPEI